MAKILKPFCQVCGCVMTHSFSNDMGDGERRHSYSCHEHGGSEEVVEDEDGNILASSSELVWD